MAKLFLGNIKVGKVKLGTADVKLFLGSKRIYPLSPISGAVVTCDSTIYNGSNQVAHNIVVTLDGSTLIENTDYIIEENSGGTNVGSYSVVVVGTGLYDGTASGTFVINKVTPTVTAPTPKTLVYNGSNQVLANAGSTNWGTLQYCLNNSGGTYSTTVPSASEANITYKVWYKVVGNSNVNDVSPNSIDCFINEKDVTGTITLSQTAYTYNGSACEPSVTVSDGATVIDPSEYSVSYSNNVNAGTATVTVTDNPGGDYHVGCSTTFTINKANGSVTINGVSLTYNGNNQNLATVSGPTGTMHYSTNGTSWSTSIPQGKDVGSWNIYWYMDASTNYNGISSASSRYVSSSIGKANQSAPTATGATVYYHSTATATASGGGGQGTLTWTNGNTRTETGTTVTAAYWAGNSNYNASPNSNSVNLVVNKATDQSVTVTLTDRTYNGSGQVVASATSHGCTFYLGFGSSSTSAPSSWGSANSSISQTNAGTYYVWYKATADKNHSADISATYKGTVTIGKANQSAPTATGATTTYNTTATATASGGGGVGSIEWSNGNTQTSVGSKSTQARWTGDSNYNASPWSNSVTVQMNKANGSVTINGVSLTYNGSSRNLATVSNNTGTMHYSTNGSSWSTSIPTSTNAGSWNIYWYMDASTNYNGISSASSRYVSSSISKAAGSVTTAPTAKSLTYNGDFQSLVNAGSGTGTMYYRLGTSGGFSTTIPPAANASTYTVYYYAAASTNYEQSATGSVAVTISKANQNAPGITGATTTYPTTATATASGGGGQGSLQWDGAQSQTSVGSHSTRARWSGNSNYNASPYSSHVTVQMNKASRTMSWTSAPGSVPSGSTITVSASPSAGSGDGAITYSSSNTNIASVNGSTITGKGVGTCTITATIAAGTNYNSASVSYTLTVDYAYVNLGLPSGRLWAKHNVGSSSETGYGYLFSWGNTTGYANNSGHDWGSVVTDSQYANTTGARLSSNIPTNATYDAARAAWGGSWRMPTQSEMEELYNYTTPTVTTINGVYGVKFTSSNGNYIFFPYGGYGKNTSVSGIGTDGRYWLSTIFSSKPEYGQCYSVDRTSTVSDNLRKINKNYRCRGLSIRPVK